MVCLLAPSEIKVKLKESPFTSVVVALCVPAVPSGFFVLPQVIGPVRNDVPAALVTFMVLVTA